MDQDMGTPSCARSEGNKGENELGGDVEERLRKCSDSDMCWLKRLCMMHLEVKIVWEPSSPRRKEPLTSGGVEVLLSKDRRLEGTKRKGYSLFHRAGAS